LNVNVNVNINFNVKVKVNCASGGPFLGEGGLVCRVGVLVVGWGWGVVVSSLVHRW